MWLGMDGLVSKVILKCMPGLVPLAFIFVVMDAFHL